MGHKVEKTESRSKIVTKSQQSFHKTNRTEIGSFLSSDIDWLDCKRFAHVFIRLRLFHFIGHKVEKTKPRSKIVTKSQQSLLNKSNRMEIRSFLSY